nr:FAST kinase domain-containing protein 1, mitochondrial [Cavia porcellus]
MFRLRATCPFFCKVFPFQPFSCERLIIQINKCTDEEKIFDLIERNKATLSAQQAGHAFNILWRLQRQKTNSLQNVEYIRHHPMFPTLCNLTTNKIESMSDDTLVNVLYIAQRFAVAVHDPLIESLVTEAWKRVERFDMNALSTFSACLADQQLHCSPLMGKIADVVNRKLESIQDLRSLSVLMVSISSLISQHFQEKLVKKTELLFDTLDSSQVSTARQIVQFLRNVKCAHYPLLQRCDKVFLSNVTLLDLDGISNILAVYQFLHFYSFEFTSVAKKRLAEMIPLVSHPESFVKLFVALGPVAGLREKKQLKSTLLLMSEQLTSKQALAVVTVMEEMESRNSQLIKKIASILYENLENYSPMELSKITQALIFLQFQNKEVFTKLRELLLSLRRLRAEAVATTPMCSSSGRIRDLEQDLRRSEHLTVTRRRAPISDTLDPLMLVYLGHSLAILECFPEDLLKAIFNIQFLARLDSQLEILPSSLSTNVQFRLMELNRAVCLECPELQIPWFHDDFCQQQIIKGTGHMSGAQQQIYKVLSEVLGGPNFVKALVLSSYYHRVDFECILDKRKQPLSYGGHNTTLGKPAKMYGDSNIQIVGPSLPAGAERIVIKYLDSKSFCTNIPHLQGKSAMRKRHLEILGYRLIQIPHFEWNSMALSVRGARMDYLRQHIFGDRKS